MCRLELMRIYFTTSWISHKFHQWHKQKPLNICVNYRQQRTNREWQWRRSKLPNVCITKIISRRTSELAWPLAIRALKHHEILKGHPKCSFILLYERILFSLMMLSFWMWLIMEYSTKVYFAIVIAAFYLPTASSGRKRKILLIVASRIQTLRK